MLRLHVEQRQRRDGAGRQQGVAQLEEGILPPTEGGIRRGAEAGKRSKGIHVVQLGTYRRRTEGQAPYEVKSQVQSLCGKHPSQYRSLDDLITQNGRSAGLRLPCGRS